MNYLKKIWIRILVSLLLGSILAEIIHIIKGFMPMQISNFIVISTAIFSFSVITLLLRLKRIKEQNLIKSKEDILDS
jgi:hypothetical protein